jgi:hypothetical protein
MLKEVQYQPEKDFSIVSERNQMKINSFLHTSDESHNAG